MFSHYDNSLRVVNCHLQKTSNRLKCRLNLMNSLGHYVVPSLISRPLSTHNGYKSKGKFHFHDNGDFDKDVLSPQTFLILPEACI